MSKSDFFDKHRGRNFGYGERAIVEEGGLNPVSDFFSDEQLVSRVLNSPVNIDIDV